MIEILKRYIYSLTLLVIFILSLVTNWYTPLVISLIVVLMIMVLDKMGKGIVLRESTAVLYAITCLAMPVIGYEYYSASNLLARVWVKYMPVTEDVYFGFALPAIAGFCLALTWPLGVREILDEGPVLRKFIERIKTILTGKKNPGLYIIIIGVVLGRISNILPGALQFFAALFYFGAFAGLLYIYFKPDFRHKRLLIGGFIVLIAMNALSTGMFTVVAYMGITIYSFFLLKSNPSIVKKVAILFGAVVFMIVLQNTKGQYRKNTWLANENFQGNKVELFSQLFIENLQRGGLLMDNQAFFGIYTRTNQGFNVGLVMRRFPSQVPHDNGRNLGITLAASVVPRLFWPDKPEAGGKFNMKYYTGITLRGWSSNVGPIGEAYGSFGVLGGVVFMIFLGLFIRWAYKLIFKIANKIPLLILWIPVMFYQITYSAETDTLQILNSLFKSAIFVWLLYKIIPGFLGVIKKRYRPAPPPAPPAPPVQPALRID